MKEKTYQFAMEMGNLASIALALKKVQIDHSNGMVTTSELSDTASAAAIEILKAATSITSKLPGSEKDRVSVLMAINRTLEDFNKAELLSFDINEN